MSGSNRRIGNRLFAGLLLGLALGCAGVRTGDAVRGEVSRGTSAAPIDIPNARVALPGVLSGGQPSPEQLEQAAAAGFRTVVNLRSPAEPGFEDEEALVRSLGMDYIGIPIAGTADFNEANARRVAEAVSRVDAGGVLLHCASGNRVGALLAVKSVLLDGASVEAALDLGRRAGMTRLEPTIRELLSAPAPLPQD